MSDLEERVWKLEQELQDTNRRMSELIRHYNDHIPDAGKMTLHHDTLDLLIRVAHGLDRGDPPQWSVKSIDSFLTNMGVERTVDYLGDPAISNAPPDHISGVGKMVTVKQDMTVGNSEFTTDPRDELLEEAAILIRDFNESEKWHTKEEHPDCLYWLKKVKQS